MCESAGARRHFSLLLYLRVMYVIAAEKGCFPIFMKKKRREINDYKCSMIITIRDGSGPAELQSRH